MGKTVTKTTVVERGKIRKLLGVLVFIYALFEIIGGVLSIIYTLILDSLPQNINNFITIPITKTSLIPFFIDYTPIFISVIAIIEGVVLILIARWLRKDKVITTIETTVTTQNLKSKK